MVGVARFFFCFLMLFCIFLGDPSKLEDPLRQLFHQRWPLGQDGDARLGSTGIPMHLGVPCCALRCETR